MTTQNTNTENKSITDLIKEHFEKGLNTNQIREELSLIGLNKSNHYIRNIVYRLKQKNRTYTNTTPINIEEYPIIIRLFENDTGDLNLYIKTCDKFEHFLKNNKELRKTSNLWNLGLEGNFYHTCLENDNRIDNINSSILVGINKFTLNRGILRIEGISQGLTFNLNDYGLINIESIKPTIKSFIKSYLDIYYRKVLNQHIDLEMNGVIA